LYTYLKSKEEHLSSI